jgi:helix-turn-helix protein
MNEQRFLFETPKLALTRVEAAKALNISPATLDRLTKRGLLHPCRALRRPLYAVEELKRFLRETTGTVDTNGADRRDPSREAFEYLRESDPHRQNDYDQQPPWRASRGR